jgi:hypothetical protein
VILSGFLKITRPTGAVSSAAPTDFGACEVMRDQGGGAPATLRLPCGFVLINSLVEKQFVELRDHQVLMNCPYTKS